MDYSRPALADRLAAEFALGTLRGAARHRFEGLLPAHPVLRAAVAEWQQRLMMLGAAIVAVQPPASVWTRIEGRLFPDTRRPRTVPWWQQLALWRTATTLATAAAVAFGAVLLQPRPSLPPIIVVLAPNPEAGTRPASFVASVSADGGALVLRPLGTVPAIGAARALELWAVPAAGSPRSLGLISAHAATTVMRSRLLEGTAAFAVSIEPQGGSPTGAPTGPIVSQGHLES